MWRTRMVSRLHEYLIMTIAQFDGDFWSDELILDPYPHYQAMREGGSVVWLSQHGAYAMPRYGSVQHALTSPEVFSSASGCMMNEPMNEATGSKIMLCTDGEEHRSLRRLFAKPLTPKALTMLTPRLEALVSERIDTLLDGGVFDAVEDLAHLLPLSIVAELIGLDAEGRERMLDWANGIFETYGPIENPRTVAGLEIAEQVIGYVLERLDRAELAPDGWGEGLFKAADAGEITEERARMMLIDYIAPSLDTTINAISSAIELFADNPVQWDLLRSDPGLIPGAIDEVLRIETPIRAFARSVVRDHEIDGAVLPAGSRAVIIYASANRDALKYPDPDRFDIRRDASDHLAFGAGSHVCAGMFLAKLEMQVMFKAMAAKVKSMKVTERKRVPHNTLRGLSMLETTFAPA